MKKILFSKSHEKHYTGTVVRMGKNNLGFSIVELIIIIAIMAILAAIAIPVLGVFIEKAEMNNDRKVVGDIIYAIDLANEQGAFLDYQKTEIGEFEFPIAFIVISEDGTKVVTSATNISFTEKACEIVEVHDVYSVSTNMYDLQDVCRSLRGQTKEKSSIVGPTTCYVCKSHSPDYNGAVAYLTADTNYITSWSCSESGSFFNKTHTATAHTTNLAAGTKILDLSKAYMRSSQDTSKCTYAYQNQNGSIDKDSIGITENAPDSAVYMALVNVFGANFERELKLTHTEWMSSGDFGFPTLYTKADDIFEEMEDLAGLVAPISSNPITSAIASAAGVTIGGTYNNESEVLEGIATVVTAKHNTYESWEAAWIAAANSATTYAFGFSGGEGMEYYASCRKTYNMAFASYLEACGEPELAAVVNNYNSMSISALNLSMPATVTRQSFYTGSERDFNSETMNTLLYDQLGRDANKLKTVKKYYEQYLKTDTYLENCKAFYNTMKTVADTSDIANSSGDYFEYYSGYIGEMNSLYGAVTEASKNGSLVILITLKEGQAVCTLSNQDADPRNQ